MRRREWGDYIKEDEALIKSVDHYWIEDDSAEEEQYSKEVLVDLESGSVTLLLDDHDRSVVQKGRRDLSEHAYGL